MKKEMNKSTEVEEGKNMENKTKFVPFSCTEEEFEVIRKNPEFANLSMSEFIIKQNEYRAKIFKLINKLSRQKVEIDNINKDIVRILNEKALSEKKISYPTEVKEKQTDEIKEDFITLDCTVEEYEVIKAGAEKASLSISEYLIRESKKHSKMFSSIDKVSNIVTQLDNDMDEMARKFNDLSI